jgi:DNA methylase
MAHRLTSGLEDSGLEVRDVLMWLYGQGMPKSRRLAGGQGTALKPFYEPIVLARRTVTDNIARHGTGALNTDACSIANTHDPDHTGRKRWPANVIASHHLGCRPRRCAPGCPAALIDRQHPGASRFLYCAKASRRERDAGCHQLPSRPTGLFPNAERRDPRAKPVHNPHPTVKPIDLMRWLVRLACPPQGIVLDPFCGSGTTGIAAILEGRRFVGLERDAAHIDIARARITHWSTDAEPNDDGTTGRRPTQSGPDQPA